jgi:aryl-alcohol dehydrogenase-like predicted oxidoreductase
MEADGGCCSTQASGWRAHIRHQDEPHDIVEVVTKTAQRRGPRPARVAVAWPLERPAVTSVIIGGRTQEQLVDNLVATELSLLRSKLTDEVE